MNQQHFHKQTDGEKDPESYHLLQQRYPDRIKSIWIRKVSGESQRQTYDGQQYFENGFSLTKALGFVQPHIDH